MLRLRRLGGFRRLSTVKELKEDAVGEALLCEGDVIKPWSVNQRDIWEVLKQVWAEFKPSAGMELGMRDHVSAKQYRGALTFTGRENELSRLRIEVSAARLLDDRPYFVVLEGGSGSGKSRLLVESPFRLQKSLNLPPVASVLVDFGGGDIPDKRGIAQKSGSFLAVTLLFKAFLGRSFASTCYLLNEKQRQILKGVSLDSAVDMILSWHRARHRIDPGAMVLFMLLIDEPQLVSLALGDEGEFMHDMFEAIYLFRRTRTGNCNFFPLCAGTLVRELDNHQRRWGKLSIPISELSTESAVKLLESSLGPEFGKLLHSEIMRLLLKDVMCLPRFLADIYVVLAASEHLQDYITSGHFERVILPVRDYVASKVYSRYGLQVKKGGPEWKIVVAACLTEMPVPLDGIEISDARLMGYIYPEAVNKVMFKLKVPHVILQLFRSRLGLKSLLSFYPVQPKGGNLGDMVDDVVWMRMKVMKFLGLKEFQLRDLLHGAEGPDEVLNTLVPLPADIQIAHDPTQFLNTKGVRNSELAKMVGRFIRTVKGTNVSDEIHIVKGVKDGISLLTGETSLYRTCQKLGLDGPDRKNWILVFVLSGRPMEKPLDREVFVRAFPRVVFLDVKKFIPSVMTDLLQS